MELQGKRATNWHLYKLAWGLPPPHNTQVHAEGRGLGRSVTVVVGRDSVSACKGIGVEGGQRRL